MGDYMKVQVMIDEDVVLRIDHQAKRKGLSRSAYCAQSILADLLHDEAQERALESLVFVPSEKNNRPEGFVGAHTGRLDGGIIIYAERKSKR